MSIVHSMDYLHLKDKDRFSHRDDGAAQEEANKATEAIDNIPRVIHIL